MIRVLDLHATKIRRGFGDPMVFITTVDGARFRTSDMIWAANLNAAYSFKPETWNFELILRYFYFFTFCSRSKSGLQKNQEKICCSPYLIKLLARGAHFFPGNRLFCGKGIEQMQM